MTIADLLEQVRRQQRVAIDSLGRAAGIDPANPPQLRRCKHKPTEGEWLSWAHACRCLGIRHDQLFDAAYRADRVRFRFVGSKHQHVQVRTSDLVREWPEQMSTNVGSTPVELQKRAGKRDG